MESDHLITSEVEERKRNLYSDKAEYFLLRKDPFVI
jgi:hypothetical protein